MIVICPYCEAKLFVDMDTDDDTIICMCCQEGSEIHVHENSKITLEKI